jgi:hypothetical protein
MIRAKTLSKCIGPRLYCRKSGRRESGRDFADVNVVPKLCAGPNWSCDAASRQVTLQTYDRWAKATFGVVFGVVGERRFDDDISKRRKNVVKQTFNKLKKKKYEKKS